jgi:NCAIR mutase (PurE)-related protein
VTPHRLARALARRTVHQIDLGVGGLKRLEIAIRQQRQKRLIVSVSGLGSGDMLLR